MGDSLAKVLLGGEKKKLPWDFFNQKEILSINLIPRYKSKIIKELKPMFIATLFTIAKRWKQLKSLSTDEWINEWNVNSLINEWKWKCGKYTLWNTIQPLKWSKFWHMLKGEWILRTLCKWIIYQSEGHRWHDSTYRRNIEQSSS